MNTRKHHLSRWQSFKDRLGEWRRQARERAELRRNADMEAFTPFWPFFMP